jgi:hypothetical protein
VRALVTGKAGIASAGILALDLAPFLEFAMPADTLTKTTIRHLFQLDVPACHHLVARILAALIRLPVITSRYLAIGPEPQSQA